MTISPGSPELSLFLAVIATIVLATSELLFPYYGKVNILINKQKLRNVGIVVSILFLVTIAIRIINILLYA